MEEIIKLRKKHKKTQEEMAHYMEISRPTYILIERGEAEITVFQAYMMAEVFDMPYLELMEILVPEVLKLHL